MPKTIKVESLEAVQVLSEEPHYLSAARKLGIQPCQLVERISAAEEALGFSVVETSTGHVAITPEGRILMNAARGFVLARRKNTDH